MFQINFQELIYEESFSRIKYFFLIDDYKYLPFFIDGKPECINVEESCNYINKFVGLNIEEFKSGKDFDAEKLKKTYEIKKINFYEDELIPEIKRMYERYTENFIIEIENRNIFESTGIENFSKKYLNNLMKVKNDISKANHLIDKVKIEANNTINKVYDFVSNDYYQSYFKIPQKIPFNLNKNQLVVFFHLLYENGIISEEIKPTDLSRLIEQYCAYYDRESNSFLDVKRVRDLEIRIFRQDEEPNPEPSIKHLESIFSNIKFYDY